MTRTRSISVGLLLLAMLVSLLLAPGATPTADAANNYDDDHILVGWDRSLPEQARAGVHREEGGEVANRIQSIDVDVVEVPESQDPNEWVARYQRHPQVAFAELNYNRGLNSVPSDTLFKDQWGFHNTGQGVTGSFVRGVADWDIDAPEAWDAAFGVGSFPSTGGTKVAIVDTGIDRTHVDLLNKTQDCASAIALIGVVTNGTCTDDNLHGTHVAGTVAAHTGNTVGVAGTAPDAQLAICKALNGAGVGTAADVAACIEWSTKTGAKIISMSLGSERGSSAEERAVKNASAAGVLVIAAAGNGYDASPNYPAYYPEVMSVASFNQAGVISDFSTCNSDVEIAAPGEDIWSTFPENTYGVISGTSMATPHVSGAAALVMSELGLTADQTRSKLKTTGVNGLSTGGRKECASYPALNLAAAVGSGGGTTTPPPSTDPGAIAGKVSAFKGSGISGATVDCGTGGSATAATDGSYSITNVSPATYTCTASATGYRSKSQNVSVSSGATTIADFVLRKI